MSLFVDMRRLQRACSCARAALLAAMLALTLGVLLPASSAQAQTCQPPSAPGLPVAGTSVTCSGTIIDGDITGNLNGFGDGTQNGLSITVTPGSLVQGTDFGFELGTDNTISNSGSIVGTNADGIFGLSFLSVFNSGSISAPNGTGISGQDMFVNNAKSGVISGNFGIQGDLVSVINHGAISGTDMGILANVEASVFNSGTIVASGGFGFAIFAGGDLNVTNTGTIVGASAGLFATNISLFNSGSISGGDGGVTAANNATITNSGSITGTAVGVGANNVLTLFNSGTISSDMQPGSFGVIADRVHLTNSGTISGDTGVSAGGNFGAGGSTLVNSGTIRGVFSSVDFSLGAGGDTLTFLPGSRLIGSVELGNGNAPSTVNIVTGRDIGWLISFGTCGCGGLVENQSLVNFFGKAPYVVSGNQIATLDATAFGLSDRTLMDFTGSVSSLVSGRSSELGTPQGGAGATGFAAASSPIVDVANAAFASAMPVSAYAPEGRGPGVLPSATSVDRTSGTVMWSKAFGGIRKQDGDDVFLASRSTIYGAAVGLDGQLRPDLRIGLFFGAGYGKFDVARSSQTIETDYVFGGVYGRQDWNAHFLDFALTAGRSSNDNTRLVANNLAPDGLETAKSKYDGWFFSPELAYGIRIPIAQDMVLTPTARVRYLTGRFDGYAETGSAQNLVVAGRNLQDIEERFELALARFDPFVSGVLKTTVTLGAVGLQRIGDKTINTNLIGQNLAFITPGDDASYGGYLGLGFDYRASQRVNLFAGVEGTLMNDKSRTGTAKGGARIAF